MRQSQDANFGSYLLTVEERDLDLLFMEEFHVSPEFVAWFCAKLGIVDAVFAGAWHSVTDADGETDLLLRVNADGHRVAVLIENKVAASEQHRQDERYHIRGARARDAGKYDRYVTCMCAPAAYLDGLKMESLYDFRVSYEDIRDWFGRFDDRRSNWRQTVLAQAIDHGRRGYVMVENATMSAFHQDAWDYLRRHHPRVVMTRPTPKGSGSTWIVLNTHDLPKGLRINFKFTSGIVDLTLDRVTQDDLLRLGVDWQDDIHVVGHGKSASLRKYVPAMAWQKPLIDQATELESAMAAIYDLLLILPHLLPLTAPR